MKKINKIYVKAQIDNRLKRFYDVVAFKVRCLKVRIGLLK
nr:MAG TPA: hypothetical protein [Caudoviricetes sp.]